MYGYFVVNENYKHYYGIVYEEGLKKRNFKIVDNIDINRAEGYKKCVLVPEEIVFFSVTFPKDLKSDLKYIQIENEVVQRMESLALDPSKYDFIYREYKNKKNKKLIDVYIYIYPKKEEPSSVNEVYFVADFLVDEVRKSKNEESYIVMLPFKEMVVEFFFLHGELKNVRVVYYSDLDEEAQVALQIFNEEYQTRLEESGVFRLDRDLGRYLEFLKIKEKCCVVRDEVLGFLFAIHTRLKPIKENNRAKLIVNKTELRLFTLVGFVSVGLVLALSAFLYYESMDMSAQAGRLTKELQNIQAQSNKIASEVGLVKKFESSNILKQVKSLRVPVEVEFLYTLKKYAKAHNIKVLNIEAVKDKKEEYLKIILQGDNIDDMKAYFTNNKLVDKFETVNVYFVGKKVIMIAKVNLVKVNYGE